jgi:thiol-disulfide isomerase/thioredoxin
MKNTTPTNCLQFGFLVSMIWLLSVIITFAQTGYKISGQIKGLNNSRLVLSHYFGSSQRINKDTTHTDSTGRFLFANTKTLPEGLYMLTQPSKGRVCELIIDADQTFSIETDTLNAVAAMVVRGSVENELFYKHQKNLRPLNEEMSSLQVQQRLRNDAVSTNIYQNKMQLVRKQMVDIIEKFIKENTGTFSAKLAKAGNDIMVPTPPAKADSMWAYRYYKSHFWDNIDFADERMIRTPIFQRRLDYFIKNMVAPQADSINLAADEIIKKAIIGKQKEVISYCIWNLTSRYENPEIVGTDAVFVHLAEKYYLGGIMPIVDSSTITSIGEKVKTLKPLLVGKVFPALSLSDTLRRPVALSNLQAKYTIVLLYDPSCAHCKASMPIIKTCYEKNKNKDIRIFAVAVTGSPDTWKQFIKEYEIQEWTHGYDFTFKIDYRRTYDLIKAPMLYVLDSEKKIIGKRIPAEQLNDFLNYIEQQ